MSLHRHKQEWETLAVVDPLWAILSDPERQYGRWELAAFFATGEAEIADILHRASTFGYPQTWDRALDFGCGVGRLTRALSAHFAECVGVDISAAMLEQARAYNRAHTQCQFLLNEAADLGQFADHSFDLVYSNIVLQHLPSTTMIQRYIAEFLRVTRPTGVVIFQLPCHIPWRNRLQLRRRLYAGLRGLGISEALLYRRLGLNPIRMNALPEATVTRIITSCGGVLFAADHDRGQAGGIQGRCYFVGIPERPSTPLAPGQVLG